MRSKMAAWQAVQAIGRPIFTTREIALLRRSSLESTIGSLRRLERQGVIKSATRGIWCIPADPQFSPFGLVPFLSGKHQAYISFLSALHLHGLISQIPQIIYAATTGHTRTVRTRVGTFSFHRIHPRFFGGFDWYGDRKEFLIASPEKALVDTIYLSSRKGRKFRHFPEIEFPRRFSMKRTHEWANAIPYQRIRRYVIGKLKGLTVAPKQSRRVSRLPNNFLQER